MNDNNIYSPPQADLLEPLTEENASSQEHLATRWARFWASIIDSILSAVALFSILYVTGYMEAGLSGQLSVVGHIILGLMGLAIFVLLHGYLLATRGQSIGKYCLGTRIVSVHTNKILPLRKILIVRVLPLTIVGSIPVVGQFLILLNCLFIYRADRRCLHDLLAGTRVVKV